MVAVVLGEAVPRFDLLMGLIGALLTGPLMFLLPPLFYVKIRSLHGRRLKPKAAEGVCYRTFPSARPERAGAAVAAAVRLGRPAFLSLVVLAGTAATVLSTVSTVRDTVAYARFTPSCLMQWLAASE